MIIMENERREKFVDLAQNRTNNAINQIRLIGNLSNRGNYEYSDRDIHKILKALNAEIRAMKERFSAGGKDSGKLFKL